MSPLISQGLATMSQFELVMPTIRRRNITETNDTYMEESSRMLHSLYTLYDDNEENEENPRRRWTDREDWLTMCDTVELKQFY